MTDVVRLLVGEDSVRHLSRGLHGQWIKKLILYIQYNYFIRLFLVNTICTVFLFFCGDCVKLDV